MTEEQDHGHVAETIEPKEWQILLVENDEAEIEAFCRVYGEEFSIDVATTGEQALSTLRSGNYALVISDQCMPGMTGIELLTQALEEFPDIQRFLLTGVADPKVVTAGINRARIDQYVTKPWDEDALRVALRRAIEVRTTMLRTQAQMARLRAQNAALGQKVRDRTREMGEIAERQRRLSVIDGVTGLHNHRHFLERWRSEVRRSRRYGGSVALIQVEVDNLKDLSGVEPSLLDRLLKDLSLILRSAVRDVDLVARFGTREFAIVLPETPKTNGALLAGRLSQAVRERGLAHPKGGTATVSVGMGAFPDDGPTSSDVLTLTRSAMKRSRIEQGDRVYIVAAEGEALLEVQDDAHTASEEVFSKLSNAGEALPTSEE